MGLLTVLIGPEDQKTVELPSVMRRLPLTVKLRTAEGLVAGFFLLPTHIMACSGIFLYCTPIYRLFLEFDGEKKPKEKVPSEETKVSLVKRGLSGIRVSVEEERQDRKGLIIRKMKKFL